MPRCSAIVCASLTVLARLDYCHAVVSPSGSASSSPASSSPTAWTHDWSSGAAMLWADWSPDADGPDWPLSAAVIDDMASRYAVQSLEQCFGCSWSRPCNSSEANIVAAAVAMKASSTRRGLPQPSVLMYVQGTMPRSCYASDGVYMSNPAWFLRYDEHAWAGEPVRRNTQDPNLDDNTYLDPRNASARTWWAGQAYAQGPAGAIDGVFADSTTYQNWTGWSAANISMASTNAINASLLEMLNETRARGLVLYNGLADWSKYAPDFGAQTLAVTDGANVEHWGAFECIAADGSMNVTIFSALMAEAYARGNDGSGKGIFIKAWPGPVVAPIFFLNESVWGPHHMTPSWPNNSTPLSIEDRVAAMRNYFPFAFAAFLMVAGPHTYLHYAWWYDLCDGTSARCTGPSAYTDLAEWLDKPLGAPLGPPVLTGPSLYSRAFENLNVTVDIADFFSATFQWGAAAPQEGGSAAMTFGVAS